MGRVYVFADECGNFDFSRKSGASSYFILTTVTAGTCEAGDALLELRRELAWQGLGLGTDFHATTDEQAIRDRVFPVIATKDIRVDATILEKAKAEPKIRPTDERFYKYAWWLHLKYLASRISHPHDELLVIGASLGTNKRRKAFHAAVEDVVAQVSPTLTFKVASWQSVSDPCLQVADYCAWAIQRKWERGDVRSYSLIQHRVKTEFAPFAVGSKVWY